MVWDFGLWSQQPGFVHSKGIWGVLNVDRDKLLVLRFRGLGVSWNHTIPGKPVTHNYRQRSPNFLLLWVIVAHYYG